MKSCSCPMMERIRHLGKRNHELLAEVARLTSSNKALRRHAEILTENHIAQVQNASRLQNRISVLESSQMSPTEYPRSTL